MKWVKIFSKYMNFKKIVYNDLKKEIKKKIDFQNTTESKTNIDRLILAVDKKIKTGEMHEEK